jgi:hypothetical protein
MTKIFKGQFVVRQCSILVLINVSDATYLRRGGLVRQKYSILSALCSTYIDRFQSLEKNYVYRRLKMYQKDKLVDLRFIMLVATIFMTLTIIIDFSAYYFWKISVHCLYSFQWIRLLNGHRAIIFAHWKCQGKLCGSFATGYAQQDFN